MAARGTDSKRVLSWEPKRSHPRESDHEGWPCAFTDVALEIVSRESGSFTRRGVSLEGDMLGKGEESEPLQIAAIPNGYRERLYAS